MAVKLSICIPTYNRSEYLTECLDSILTSAAGFEHSIDLVISDNASTDNTASVVRKYVTAYPWIRYHRNEDNIGGDPNIYLVSRMGTGEYIWLFGDDDKMTREAVATVMRHIDDGYNLIICNYSIWTKDFSCIIKSNGLAFASDKAFNNRNQLMGRIGHHMGYISSIIARRDVYFTIPEGEYSHYITYSFPQIFAVYSGISQWCNAICISAILVLNRSDNHRDVNWRKAYLIGMSIIFEGLAHKGYSKSAIVRAKHGVLSKILVPGIIGYKLANRTLPCDIFSLLYQHYKGNWLFWIATLPALLLPPIFFRFARNTKKLFRP